MLTEEYVKSLTDTIVSISDTLKCLTKEVGLIVETIGEQRAEIEKLKVEMDNLQKRERVSMTRPILFLTLFFFFSREKQLL